MKVLIYFIAECLVISILIIALVTIWWLALFYFKQEIVPVIEAVIK